MFQNPTKDRTLFTCQNGIWQNWSWSHTQTSWDQALPGGLFVHKDLLQNQVTGCLPDHLILKPRGSHSNKGLGHNGLSLPPSGNCIVLSFLELLPWHYGWQLGLNWACWRDSDDEKTKMIGLGTREVIFLEMESVFKTLPCWKKALGLLG